MTEALQQIRHRLSVLATRERLLLLLRAFLIGAGTGLGLWLGLCLLANLGWLHPSHRPLWLSLWALSALISLIFPLRRIRLGPQWRRQAEHLERLLPDLQGRLLTVLDRAGAAQSPVLLQRAAQKVAPVVQEFPAFKVWPAKILRGPGVGLTLAFLGLILAQLLLPTGPMDALAALSTPTALQDAPSNPQQGPKALVGDITLRYLYPAYTNREPLEVANSNGEVHAPPGTRVEIRARAANRVQTAALQVDQEEPLPAELEEGRQVSSAFDIQKDGHWRLLLDAVSSPDYKITVEPDLPPDVSVQAAAQRFSIAADQPLPMLWRARDDYGLQRMVVQIQEKGKAARELPLPLNVGQPREAGASLRMTPTELGLAPGSTATLKIGGWDNDAISGSKVGWSSAISLEVVGASGQAPELAAWREALRDALVDALAEFLVDESPPFETAAESESWGEAARQRYVAIEKLAVERVGGVDGEVLKTLFDQRASFLGFVSTLGRGNAGAIAEADLTTLGQLQAAHIAALEDSITYFDQVVQQAQMKDLLELLQHLRTEANELGAEADSLTSTTLTARHAQLERLLEQVEKKASTLQDEDARSFLQDRLRTVTAVMNEAQKASADKRVEEARDLTHRSAKEIEEMVNGFEELMQRGRSRSEEMGKDMQNLQEELKKLEKEQEDLRQQSEQARQRLGPDMEKASRQWEALERDSQALAERTRELTDHSADSPASSALDAARHDTSGLSDSIRARDLETAQQRAYDTENSLRIAEARAQYAQSMGKDTSQLRQEISTLKNQAHKLRQTLDQMASQAAQTPPELQQALQQQAAAQQDLSQRINEARKQANSLSQQLPVRAPGLKEGTEQATEQSKRASQAMSQGDPTATEGGQQSAEDGLKQAQEALQQAGEKMSQMSQGGQGSEDRTGSSTGDGENDPGRDFDFPPPEDFHTPEEYRRALLEGMEGEVPEEYKALNRRYYEELVRQ